MNGVLVLTYHAVEEGPPPLCLDPRTFRAHVEAVAESGVPVLTVSELAAALRAGALPERAVALTFDDGFASVARVAAPLLLERGLKATVFCVAGRLGGMNDWPTQPARAPRRALAGAAELADLARGGFEIGSHGMEHTPLAPAAGETLRREIAGSRRALEEAVGAPVASFAYPYGLLPGDEGRRLVAGEYTAACAGGLRPATASADPFALPRVDAHYLRRPERLRAALEGSATAYLAARRIGARARRAVRADHFPAST